MKNLCKKTFKTCYKLYKIQRQQFFLTKPCVKQENIKQPGPFLKRFDMCINIKQIPFLSVQLINLQTEKITSHFIDENYITKTYDLFSLKLLMQPLLLTRINMNSGNNHHFLFLTGLCQQSDVVMLQRYQNLTSKVAHHL